MADDYRCRSSKGCNGRTSDGAAITAKADTLCAACVQDLQRQLEELPHLATALHAFMAISPTTALQSKVNSTPEPSCPINPRVDELLGDIADVLDRTDGLKVADLIQQPTMEFVLWFRNRRQKRWLTGWQRALDIRRAHARANAILGFDRVWVKRLSPCWQCGLPTVGGYVGDSTVLCQECGAVFFNELTEEKK